jgi:hypothetical protein
LTGRRYPRPDTQVAGDCVSGAPGAVVVAGGPEAAGAGAGAVGVGGVLRVRWRRWRGAAGAVEAVAGCCGCSHRGAAGTAGPGAMEVVARCCGCAAAGCGDQDAADVVALCGGCAALRCGDAGARGSWESGVGRVLGVVRAGLGWPGMAGEYDTPAGGYDIVTPGPGWCVHRLSLGVRRSRDVHSL